MASEKSRVRRIPGGNARNLSFSRGRVSLFRMANELCTLCAVEIAIILFSPSGKAYCFGHPSVDSVIRRFWNSDPSFDQQAKTNPHIDHDTTSELDEECSDLMEEAKDERKRQEELKQKVQEFRTGHPLDAPIDSLSLEELLSMKRALEDLEKAVDRRKRELTTEAAVSSSATAGGASG